MQRSSKLKAPIQMARSKRFVISITRLGVAEATTFFTTQFFLRGFFGLLLHRKYSLQKFVTSSLTLCSGTTRTTSEHRLTPSATNDRPVFPGSSIISTDLGSVPYPASGFAAIAPQMKCKRESEEVPSRLTISKVVLPARRRMISSATSSEKVSIQI